MHDRQRVESDDNRAQPRNESSKELNSAFSSWKPIASVCAVTNAYLTILQQ